MKISISLSERAFTQLQGLVQEYDSNPSSLCEAGIVALAQMEPARRAKLLRETKVSKRTLTARAWRVLFWGALAEEFDREDMARGNERFLMAPREYRGFQVIYDARHDLEPGHDNEVIVFTDTAPPFTERTRRIGTQWMFRIDQPVYEAAGTVASWIREHEGELAT
jgi:hypothetical protein